MFHELCEVITLDITSIADPLSVYLMTISNLFRKEDSAFLLGKVILFVKPCGVLGLPGDEFPFLLILCSFQELVLC